MSDKPLPPVSIVTPEEYGRNLAQIQAAKAYIAEMERTNEAGRESYESELLRKIREGQEALYEPVFPSLRYPFLLLHFRQRLQDLERLILVFIITENDLTALTVLAFVILVSMDLLPSRQGQVQPGLKRYLCVASFAFTPKIVI